MISQSIDPPNSPLQPLLNLTQRLVHPRHRPSKIGHHQRNHSNLPRRPPRPHPIKILKQLLRSALSPQPLEPPVQREIAVSDPLRPESIAIIVVVLVVRRATRSFLFVRRRSVSSMCVMRASRVSSPARPAVAAAVASGLLNPFLPGFKKGLLQCLELLKHSPHSV